MNWLFGQAVATIIGAPRPAKPLAQEEPVQPETVVWVCLHCSRAFSEQAQALDHHTRKKHRLSKRRVE